MRTELAQEIQQTAFSSVRRTEYRKSYTRAHKFPTAVVV